MGPIFILSSGGFSFFTSTFFSSTFFSSTLTSTLTGSSSGSSSSSSGVFSSPFSSPFLSPASLSFASLSFASPSFLSFASPSFLSDYFSSGGGNLKIAYLHFPRHFLLPFSFIQFISHWLSGFLPSVSISLPAKHFLPYLIPANLNPFFWAISKHSFLSPISFDSFFGRSFTFLPP